MRFEQLLRLSSTCQTRLVLGIRMRPVSYGQRSGSAISKLVRIPKESLENNGHFLFVKAKEPYPGRMCTKFHGHNPYQYYKCDSNAESKCRYVECLSSKERHRLLLF